MTRIYVSWAEIERLVRRLAAHLPEIGRRQEAPEEPFDRVIGVARGGVAPAVLLAAALDVPTLQTVQVRHYEGTRRLEGPRLCGPCPAPCGPSGDPRATLIVDEILDSGKTLDSLRSHFPEACYCSLFARHAAARGKARGEVLGVPAGTSTDSPTVWIAGDVPTRAWVLFPWSPREDREVLP